MKLRLILAGAVVAASVAGPASAQVMIEMSEITCKQFSEYDAETKDFIGNWMRGFYSAKINMDIVDMKYVKRNTDKVLRYCKKMPKSTLMDAIQKNAR